VGARYFQPFNGARVDVIRNALESEFRDSPLFPILLTSLIDAADRVDSTTGIQMAYVKQWAPRSFSPLELREPELLAGSGHALRGDAAALVSNCPSSTWPTLTRRTTSIAISQLPHLGNPCGVGRSRSLRDRPQARGQQGRSHQERLQPEAPHARRLGRSDRGVRAETLVVSYNNEAWIGLDELVEMCAVRDHVQVLAFDTKRYVGAQIGIYNPSGEKVGACRICVTWNTSW